MERDFDPEFLRNSFKQVSCHPEMITHFDSLAGTDLEFPLGRHDFSIDSADFNTGVQTGFVVCFNDITSVDFSGTDTAIVGALRTRETTYWPAVWFAIGIEEGVFLFETEPGVMGFVFFHQFGTFGTEVEFVGGAVRVVAFGKDQDVVSATEGIWVHGNWLEIDIRIVSRCLS